MDLYRGMRLAADGLPEHCPGTNVGLSVRSGPAGTRAIDIPVEDGHVQPNTGGMSTFTVVDHIRPHYLPKRYGGADDSMEVFRLDQRRLAPAVLTAYRAGKATHFVIAPVVRCPLQDFEGHLFQTRPDWTIHP